MKCRPVYKVVIELASGGRWDKHFIGRPAMEVLVQTLNDEMIQRRGHLTQAGQNSDKTKARYEDYITMVKHFWPLRDDMVECHSCGTYVGGICLTKEIVAIITESDPGKGAA
jgi:hypothetical protein